MTAPSFFARLSERLLARQVGVFGEVPSDRQIARPASVLIPLFLNGEAIELLFIRRTAELPTHPGQIAFPGGSREPEDADAWEAAKREAQEEIGLKGEDCELLGPLDRLVTFTGFDISPFVARIPHPYRFQAERREVAEILFLPFAPFLDPAAYKPVFRGVRGVEREIPSYWVKGIQVWGVTGFLVQQLVALAKPLL
jgi:8-oxo-dGTP pyrophosphatase MutT (NUDIX family)